MKNKLDVLTTYNGSKLSDSLFKMFLIIHGFGIGSTIIIKFMTELTFTFQVLPVSLLLVMPFLFFINIASVSVMNTDYYRKARYYMIPLSEIFKYFLKEIFALKNIVMILCWDIYFILFYYSYGMQFTVKEAVGLLTALLILPILAFIGFLFTTYMGKYKTFLHIVIFLATMYGSLILIVITSAIGVVYALIPFIVIDIVFYLLIVRNIIRIESKMEV